jgi:hypothetical protein
LAGNKYEQQKLLRRMALGDGHANAVGRTYTILAIRMTGRTFRRVRESAKSDYKLRHVCPSACKGKLGSHWTYFFHDI